MKELELFIRVGRDDSVSVVFLVVIYTCQTAF